MEEDISKAAPGNNKKLSYVVKHLKTSDKIIFLVSCADTSTDDPDKLILCADEFADSLQSGSFSRYVKDITWKINDSVMTEVVEVFYSYLPLFLDESDYVRIDSLITDTTIKHSLEKNYRTILSPSGFIMKKYIRRDPVGISSIVLNKLKQLQFDENYEVYNGHIFEKGRKNLLIFINPVFPTSETDNNAAFVEKLDVLITHFSAKFQDSITIDYFGAAAVAVGNAKQIKQDIAWSVTISLLIIFIFIAWYFRKISIPLISFLPAVFGGALAMAIICAFKTSISVIAFGIGSVLLGIIVDYALYICSIYKYKESVEDMLKDMSQAIILCSISSATAFLSLLFVQSEVLQDLGLFAAISVLGAAAFSLVFLPHFITYKKPVHKDSVLKKLIDKIADFPFEKNKYFITAILISIIVSLFYYKDVEFEKDMNKLNFLSEKMALTEQKINRLNDISLKSVFVVSMGKDINDALANDARNSAELEALKKENIIIKYSSVSPLLIADSVQKERIADWEAYWTKDKQDQLKESILIFSHQIGFSKDAFNEFYTCLYKKYESLPPDKFAQIVKTFFADRITERPEMSMVLSLVKVKSENKDKVFKAFAAQNNTVVFDKQIITSSFVENINTDFNALVEMCLLFITLFVIFSFGRIEIGIIASVPMYISWLLILGFMGLFGIKFNIFNIIVSTFVFGLGVDYSILMVRGLLLDYKYGRNELSSYKTSIFLSSFTTIVGVGVLIIAKHPALNSIALITVFGLFSVVMVSYIIKPVLFYFITSDNAKKGRLPYTIWDLIFTFIAFLFFIFACLSNCMFFLAVFILPVKNKFKKRIMHYLIKAFCTLETFMMINVRKRILNPCKENFREPALIISNHQSCIDVLFLLKLHSKTIVLTNNRIGSFPVLSYVFRYMDIYHISDFSQNRIEQFKQKIQDGYSILAFPEGSCSGDSKIKRFHKSIFQIAGNLKLDIVPVILHGSGDGMSKGENILKYGIVTLKICKRIDANDVLFGSEYIARTKSVFKFFKAEYSKLAEECGTPKYNRNKVVRNYIYKGPVLEWYVKIKLKFENNYELYDRLIPRNASIIDIGCGYGYLAYMLNFVSGKRRITGIDYDKSKIEVAGNCVSKCDRVKFIYGDATNIDFEKTDVFVLSDILHYISEDRQKHLMEKCFKSLNDDGFIIVRDGDNELKKRHKVTVFTELFSKGTGFNKFGEEKMFFTSSSRIKEIASANGMNVDVIDNTKRTSNLLYIIKRDRN
ncbi:MAG: 1-acyl-sn-glycerol-3-phosphate acyltransferase [Bacteroidota bacterium]